MESYLCLSQIGIWIALASKQFCLINWQQKLRKMPEYRISLLLYSCVSSSAPADTLNRSCQTGSNNTDVFHVCWTKACVCDIIVIVILQMQITLEPQTVQIGARYRQHFKSNVNDDSKKYDFRKSLN
ncbi:hypothetical protein ILYODFUR_035774 [Ilyodon furcidens]|uniref:Uncharacterized protein n=1 Tax=Ilyodon furcidens TaxID=33524 RepID=A0ABV0TQU3_9TELE